MATEVATNHAGLTPQEIYSELRSLRQRLNLLGSQLDMLVFDDQYSEVARGWKSRAAAAVSIAAVNVSQAESTVQVGYKLSRIPE